MRQRGGPGSHQRTSGSAHHQPQGTLIQAYSLRKARCCNTCVRSCLNCHAETSCKKAGLPGGRLPLGLRPLCLKGDSQSPASCVAVAINSWRSLMHLSRRRLQFTDLREGSGAATLALFLQAAGPFTLEASFNQRATSFTQLPTD